ncbi:uncharacterized protein LOC123692902 [Colias croceus]|uniref:uncharacterized protein LOC123692902 n=1 Tax=Colias crocea TaxID=72248 RepID=UPI001E28100A|nr:uncharacterized protein LOC123692902 [Colias croceus]
MACAKIKRANYSYWNNIPSDVLMHIYSYLNFETLSTCFRVNKAWRDMGIYYCDHYRLWDRMVQECLSNYGESHRLRSCMTSKETYLNALLWQDVGKAKRHIRDYYQKDGIKHIHVCKEMLIVVTDNCVQILNVYTFKLIKSMNIKCVDYQESATLFTILSAPVPGVEESHTLKIYKKGTCHCTDSEYSHPIPKTTLYSVHDRGCYFFDESYTLWAFLPKCGRHLRLMGRYYGQREPVYSLSIHTNGVYIYLLNGSVLFVDKTSRNISIIFRVNAPAWIFNLKPLTFDRLTVVYGTNDSHDPSIYENKIRNSKVLVFPNLSAAVMHGDMLLLGFDDGAFGIYKPGTMSTELGGAPELQFRIQFSDQPPVTIRELDVHECFGKHTIFALIGNRIAKIVMTYPQYYNY